MKRKIKGKWVSFDIESNPGASDRMQRLMLLAGDTHVADDAMKRGTEAHERLEKYGTLAGADHIAFVGYSLGDYLLGDMHEELRAFDPDSINKQLLLYAMGFDKVIEAVKDVDYKHIEERIMVLDIGDVMHKIEEPKIRPTRAPKKRDWEQRNRKQRRR